MAPSMGTKEKWVRFEQQPPQAPKPDAPDDEWAKYLARYEWQLHKQEGEWAQLESALLAGTRMVAHNIGTEEGFCTCDGSRDNRVQLNLETGHHRGDGWYVLDVKSYTDGVLWCETGSNNNARVNGHRIENPNWMRVWVKK